MASAIEIISVVNVGDGVSATVTFSGTPTGPLVFHVSRHPEYLSSSVAPAVIVGNVATVTVANADGWFFWAVDNNGPSASAAQWIALADNATDLDLVGQRLESILTDNTPLINAALQQWFPNTTLKQLVLGPSLAIRAFPSILISKPRESQGWFAFPMVKDITYSYEIALIVTHTDPIMLLQMTTRCMGQIQAILNKPQYNEMFLPSGTGLAFCQVETAESDEQLVDDNTWGAVATMMWSGKALKQNTGGPFS